MYKQQNTGSNYKIKHFVTSDAIDSSDMHVNFEYYCSFLRALVNLALHVDMLTPPSMFMKLSWGLEMLATPKFCFY